MNEEFARAWGEPGVAGDNLQIVETCHLYAKMCRTALAWEEMVRGSSVHAAFEEVRDLFIGVGRRMIDEAAKLPAFLTETFPARPASGTHMFTAILSLPDGWDEEVEAALQRAAEALQQ